MSRIDWDTLGPLVSSLAPQFFAEGNQQVYVATCCDRVLVTLEEPETCTTCGTKPNGEWVGRDDIESR